MRCPYIKKGLSIKNNGRMIPCCAYRDSTNLNIKNTSIIDYFQSSILDDLESLMESGQWPVGCIKCKQSEENNQTSMRINALAIESKLFEKYYVDLDIGDQCNSDCVMCTPDSSSKIQSRIKNHGTIDEVSYDLTKLKTNWVKDEKIWKDFETNIESIGCIKFLGGEPFIIKNIWKWLEQDSVQQKKHDIVLQITTNASILPVDKIELLNGWKDLIINVSVDATGDQFEWIRHGLDWNTVENNTIALTKLQNSTVSIQCVASIYSITGILDLLKWTNDINCLFTFIPLSYPRYLSLQYAPVNTLTTVLDKLKQIKMKKIQNQIQLNSLKKFIQHAIEENKHNPDVIKKVTDYFNSHRIGTMDYNLLTLITDE
jgi:molybdenum cofactor biosynthesis enzyme MoaA